MSKKNTDKQQKITTKEIEPLVRYENLIPWQRHRLLVILRFCFSGLLVLFAPYLLYFCSNLEPDKIYEVLNVVCRLIAAVLFGNAGLIAFATIRYQQIATKLANKYNIEKKIINHIVAQANVCDMVLEDNKDKYTHIEMKDKTIFNIKTGEIVEKITNEEGVSVWTETSEIYKYYKIFQEAVRLVKQRK